MTKVAGDDVNRLHVDGDRCSILCVWNGFVIFPLNINTIQANVSVGDALRQDNTP